MLDCRECWIIVDVGFRGVHSCRLHLMIVEVVTVEVVYKCFKFYFVSQ